MRRSIGRIALVVLAGLGVLVVVAALLPSEERDVSSVSVSDAWISFSRNGKTVAFASDRDSSEGGYGLYVARLGTTPRRISGSAYHHGWPAISPDGSRIAFSRSALELLGPRRLYVVRADGRGLRRLTTGEAWAPTWSPDGSTIAFTRGKGPLDVFGDVYAVDADGAAPRLVVRDAQQPDWSPDGSSIAFVRDLSAGIAVVDLESGDVRHLVRSPRAQVAEPAWSPDGTRIAFADVPRDARVEEKYGVSDFLEIYVVGTDGSGLRRLTRNAEIDSNPAWTRDGRIVFERAGDRGSRLFVMNADGTGVRRFVIARER